METFGQGWALSFEARAGLGRGAADYFIGVELSGDQFCDVERPLTDLSGIIIECEIPWRGRTRTSFSMALQEDRNR